MSYFCIPTFICSEIEAMINKFYWGGDVDKMKLNRLRWKRLAQPKTCGGLDFQIFNIALLAKKSGKVLKHLGSLMVRSFKTCYFRNSPPWLAKCGSCPNYTWRSIFNAKWVLRREIFESMWFLMFSLLIVYINFCCCEFYVYIARTSLNFWIRH